jgi:hypothetical protein
MACGLVACSLRRPLSRLELTYACGRSRSCFEATTNSGGFLHVVQHRSLEDGSYINTNDLCGRDGAKESVDLPAALAAHEPDAFSTSEQR